MNHTRGAMGRGGGCGWGGRGRVEWGGEVQGTKLLEPEDTT